MTRSIRNLMFISITALVVSAGAYAAFTRPGPLSPSVFEIRAIDTQGHPVAGAEVWMENQSLGMTDSFGIWRRNLNLIFARSFPVLRATPQRGNILP